MALAAAALASVAVVAGLLLSAFANTITGPAIVLTAGLLFVLTLLRPQAN
jgi:ABC-type Mn2+/Zn2+ transport system permease subunit